MELGVQDVVVERCAPFIWEDYLALDAKLSLCLGSGDFDEPNLSNLDFCFSPLSQVGGHFCVAPAELAMEHKKTSPKKTLFDVEHGPRIGTLHEILGMAPEELHEAYPFTAGLVFNQKMLRGEFQASHVPDEVVLVGSKIYPMPANHYTFHGTLPGNRAPHRWVVGNEAGEILPLFLEIAWKAIESGEERYSTATGLRLDTQQVARLYAMVREAQLRAIPPFDVHRDQPRPWLSTLGSPSSVTAP